MKGRLQVLICTDTASEGLNLQAASMGRSAPASAAGRPGSACRVERGQRRIPLDHLRVVRKRPLKSITTRRRAQALVGDWLDGAQERIVPGPQRT
jgi:hypothetical protein